MMKHAADADIRRDYYTPQLGSVAARAIAYLTERHAQGGNAEVPHAELCSFLKIRPGNLKNNIDPALEYGLIHRRRTGNRSFYSTAAPVSVSAPAPEPGAPLLHPQQRIVPANGAAPPSVRAPNSVFALATHQPPAPRIDKRRKPKAAAPPAPHPEGLGWKLPFSTPGSNRPPKLLLVDESNANQVQHGGTHYKRMPIEPWDYIAANDIGFLEGNAIKYLSRWRTKGGIEDVHKARHYIDKLLEVEAQRKQE